MSSTSHECPDEDTLLAFVSGVLSTRDVAAVELHLDTCAACREVVAEAGDALAGSWAEHDTEAPVAAARPSWPRTGERVGRYHLLEILGRGAMGVVYAAFDPELERKVAVKLIYRGAADAAAETLEARLVSEAQAMAQLSHRNVVAVHDIGTFEGSFYIAMELVNGVTLREWLAAKARDWRSVVAVFREAGAGLAAAHEAGIIHRDFKPDNVLVELADDGAAKRVVVTDFGLARSAPRWRDDARDSGDLRLTRVGAIIGTPAYMAPEQLGDGTSDARSDVFAFGVALYEALSGKHPYGTHGSLEALAAALRHGVPAELAGPSPRWLKRLVARAVAADPAARFESMRALLDALGRDPRRAFIRVLVPVAAAVVVGASAVGWWALATADARSCRAGAERVASVWNDNRRAVVARAFEVAGGFGAETFGRTAALLDEFAAAWSAGWVDACDATHERAEQSGVMLDLRLACLGERQGELEALVTVFERADEGVVKRGPTAVAGLPQPDVCSERTRLQARVPPPLDPAVVAQVERAESMRAEAQANFLAGRLEDGRVRGEEAQALADATGYAPTIANTLVMRGRGAFLLGQKDVARALYDRAIPLALEAGDDRAVAQAATGYGHLVAVIERDVAAAERWLAIAASEIERIGGDAELRVSLLRAQGDMYVVNRRPEDAVAPLLEARAVLESGEGVDPDLRAVLDSLASAYQDLERHALAITRFARSVDAATKALGELHPVTLNNTSNLGNYLTIVGRYGEAAERLAWALERMKRTLPPDHWNLATVNHMYGLVLGNLGRYDEGMAHHDAALAVEAVIYRDNPSSTIFPLLAVVDTELRMEDDAALGRIQHIKVLVRQFLPEELALVIACDTLEAYALMMAGRHVEALPALIVGEIDARARLGPGTDLAAVLGALGRALLRLGASELAVAKQREAVALTLAEAGEDNVLVAAPRHDLGVALAAAGQREAAREELERALVLVTARPFDPYAEAESRIALAGLGVDREVHLTKAEGLVAGKTSPRAARIRRELAALR